MHKTMRFFAGISVATAALLTGCANSDGGSADVGAEVLQTLKESFAERGSAKLDRLVQTDLQRICSEAAVSGQAIADKTRDTMQKTIYEAMTYPTDGKYLGDWKEGEKIAQNGRGMQFTDAVDAVNGANCYACHQVTPQEISFGNQGPSLLHYGKLRGVKDPASKDSEAIVKYTWARIWNTHAFNTCSGMPRFGAAGILTPAQIKDVMALLLDPESPVNK